MRLIKKLFSALDATYIKKKKNSHALIDDVNKLAKCDSFKPGATISTVKITVNVAKIIRFGHLQNSNNEIQ